MEPNVRKIQALIQSFISQSLIPTRQALLAIAYVFAAQNFIQSISQRHFARHELSILNHHQRKRAFSGDVILVLILLFESSLQTRSKKVSGVRTDLAAKQIERIAEPEIDVLLNDLQWNAAEFAHVLIWVLLHELRGAFDHAAQSRVADKHVMRFFGQHETTGSRQRLESRFSQSRQLILAVTIRKHRE